MQLASHELYNLNELAMSCVNSITSMGMFLNMVQDPQLKAMIQKHFDAHVQDYNIKVAYLTKSEGTTEKLNISKMETTLNNYTASPVSNFPPVSPRTDTKILNDREIATSYLLTLKRAGREYAWAAMEMCNPGLREFVKDAFTMSCNHAYEVWQWMVSKGYYPLEPASQNAVKTVGSVYQEVRVPSFV